jgi:uncharacterized protein YndB with AHSA1/START domain
MTKKMWTIHGLLAAIFLFSGTMKLVLPLAALEAQMPIPGWFVRFLGASEFLGALGLILPELLRTAKGLTALAAGGLAIIMAGAAVITVMAGGGAAALVPLSIGLTLIYILRQFFARQPESMHVERSIQIQAAPETIFPLVEDFRQWELWSPYEKLDPAARRTFSGAVRGTGSVYEWDANRKAGAGRMEIVEAAPARRVVIKLDFLRPFKGHKTAQFSFADLGGSTVVTWAMYGEQTTLCKLVGTLMPMDRLIGGEFEKGLAALRRVAEKSTVTVAVGG